MGGLHGILGSSEQLLTVILASGSTDIDCQRDVSFLLFISSFLLDDAECMSVFFSSLEGVVAKRGGMSSEAGQ